MQEYVKDDGFVWFDPKVDKDNESLWRDIIIPGEMKFFLLKRSQHLFSHLEHKSTPFTTETMKQKFDWSKSTEKAEEVIKSIYDNKEDAELTENMKLILTNCVQISPPKRPIQK